MRTSHKHTLPLLALVALVVLASAALAQNPGLPFPTTSEVSDQKAGAVLFYNVYSSSAVNANAENTRINLTNTSSTSSAFVHLFFVDGNSCSPADAFVCLTPNQTTSFLTSDVDPGTMGYLIAVATNPLTGCPTDFNFLIGDEFVKFATGHQANLGAEAFAAVVLSTSGPGTCDATATSATLFFDASAAGMPISLNRVPRVLAVDSIPSPADGASTLVIINRFGGNLLTGAATIGSIFGILYDEAEKGFSFTFFSAACQIKFLLSDNFPRTTPRFSRVIPAGNFGWMKFWTDDSTRGILGAVLYRNGAAATSPGAFNGGHNLHKLTLNNFGTGTTAAPSITIPIFPPTC